MMKSLKLFPILLVEDDPDDIEITRRAFKKGNLMNPLYVVRDGEEAMEFLTNEGKYQNKVVAPRPGLILLDLNMPRLDGREVLKRIKKDASLRRIPTVVLTTSRQEEDVIRSYDYGANTYISKPLSFNDFIDALQIIGQYWLALAEIPPNGGTASYK